MRKFIWLLTASFALLGAAVAWADLGPPIHVKLLGPPRAAEAGVPYQGRLQIDSEVPAQLGKFEFNGAGWREIAIDAAPAASIDKDRPLVIDFTVLTSAPDQWLEFTFEMDGEPVTRQFNLSPAYVGSLLVPGATTKVAPDADVHPLDDATSVKPEPSSSDGAVAPAPGDGEKARNIRVHGRFTYQRFDGWTIGADGVTVRVMDNDSPFGSQQLAVLSTDAQGWYDVTFYWNPGFFDDAEPDLYVRFEAGNSRVNLEDATWSTTYAWETGTTNDYLGSDLDFGWLQPGDVNQHPALHQLTDLTRTWRWWIGYGFDTPFVRCNWPNGAAGAFYNGEIYVSTGEQWNEDVHSHEYGHHWVQNFAVNTAPDYCNGICDSGGCGHCIWCRETDHDAFNEGYPDWMGDVIPGSFAAAYGRAASSVYDMENVSSCGASWDDPYRTEGFLGAVVRDIGDGTNDDHAAFAETDELSLGWDEVIACVDLDHPTTPAAFLTAFKNRYPGYREGLWASAKNCGYEIDETNPPAVSSLYSTSHATSGDSPDPTIDLVWTRAYDDASGVEGYGITIAGGIGMPAAVMDIGDVTSYTTPSLAPGTYYFSIRTLDRSGKWSGWYNWSGPYTVRAPVPANLTFALWSGWAAPLVPRETADSAWNYAPAPGTLPGDAAGTYWNLTGVNNGESSTGGGFYTYAYIDAAAQWWLSWGAIGSGGGFYGNNAGPLWATGGRHTIEAKVDATDLIAETNENDNRWAHQWVWSPAAMTPGSPLVRAAPPGQAAGWDAVVDGSPLYANCDGLRMNVGSWWDVAVLRPLSGASDYDVQLFPPSGGAADGFAAGVAYSARLTGMIDAVIVNRNIDYGVYDVGVTNWNGDSSAYELTHVTNGGIAFGDSVTVPFAQDEMVKIWEFWVSTENAGAVSITVDSALENGPLYATWLNDAFQVGSLSTYSGWAQTDATGRARLDINVPDSGYNALVVYRDPEWSKGTAPIDVTIEIQRTPPDFTPLWAAGWHAPVVPRAAFDGTHGSTPAPSILYGNTPSTYFNVAVTNASPTGSATLPGNIYLDGGFAAWVVWGAFPGYGNGLFNWGYPWDIRGGRHTLAWRLDEALEYEEIHENNNVYGEQWVWSPLDLTMATPVVRVAPPSAYGGWTDVNTGETLYPNCDGLRMPDAGGYWRAVATMPGAGSDVDLRLHAPSTGAKDGFAANLSGSYWWGGESDYVLVNFNLTTFAPYDAGVVNFAGYENYATEAAASGGWISYPDGVYGPYDLQADRIVNLHEFYLVAGQYGVQLDDLGSSVDWGLTLHPADQIYQGKSSGIATAYWAGGPGQDEILNVAIPTDGYYCLAVWKRGSADLPLAGSYNLAIGPVSATGVDDGTPAPSATALVGIHPNPFNPQTQIQFELAREGAVRLEIYDLQGTLVRTLVEGSRGSGRHTETWDGRDNAGGQVASGVYMARLAAGGMQQMQKMVLLK
ncbi:MAG: T9SS type A sorting domain-containing protein [bacterium]|nr:T9SS type A sorting domain-containing protein [bacterium]